MNLITEKSEEHEARFFRCAFLPEKAPELKDFLLGVFSKNFFRSFFYKSFFQASSQAFS